MSPSESTSKIVRLTLASIGGAIAFIGIGYKAWQEVSRRRKARKRRNLATPSSRQANHGPPSLAVDVESGGFALDTLRQIDDIGGGTAE
ncbi:hypothetical protein DTO271G3_7141 [Paecilomyces variotii]|nr:hypothetical protein DTO271G3_7141 [Paecilomyces variotii]